MRFRSQIGFTGPGSKQGLAPDIVRLLPKRGRKFIDLFAGRGNITLYAMENGYEYEEWIANDIRRSGFLEAAKDHGDKITVPPRSSIDRHRMAQLATQGDPTALLLEPYLNFNGAPYGAGGPRTEGGRRSAQSHELALRGAHKLFTERNVRITALDWYDCLRAEQPGTDCAVVIDAPYLESNVCAYSPDDICPTELIAYLQAAKHPWVFCEYEQPLYIATLGEPAFRKTVQLRAPNLSTTKEQRTECIWAGPIDTRNVTVTFPPIPDTGYVASYRGFSVDELLSEIRAAIGNVSVRRIQMNKEMRMRLLPAL